MTTVNELISKKNEIISKIYEIEQKMIFENTTKISKHILDLIECVGDNFINGDYYAPDRVYVKNIEGVKNVRIGTRNVKEKKYLIYVKVYRPSGYLIKKYFKIGEYDIEIEFLQCKDFINEIDY